MRITVLTGLLLMFVLISPVAAFELGVRGYYWFPTFHGDTKTGNPALPGSTIDVKSLTDVGNSGYPAVEAYGGLGKHHVSVMYTYIGNSDTKMLPSNVNFRGKAFTVGSNVESTLSLETLDIEYEYDVFKFKPLLAGFSLGVIGKIKHIEGELKMASGTLGENKDTFSTTVPMVGLAAHVGILANLLEARAKVTGVGFSDNVYLDAMADLSVTPFPFVDIHAGYRIMKIKMDAVDNFYNDFNFAGPYVGLSVGF